MWTNSSSSSMMVARFAWLISGRRASTSPRLEASTAQCQTVLARRPDDVSINRVKDQCEQNRHTAAPTPQHHVIARTFVIRDHKHTQCSKPAPNAVAEISSPKIYSNKCHSIHVRLSVYSIFRPLYRPTCSPLPARSMRTVASPFPAHT